MTTNYRKVYMKIGILGAGSIGTILARRLSARGHEVRVANSRGPETIGRDALMHGAVPVMATEAAVDADVVICSIPFGRIPSLAPFLERTPSDAVVIDTSNYFPKRDGRIDAVEAGQVESVWVSEKLGRPIVKAWNAIAAESFADKAADSGQRSRIVVPIAADREADRVTAAQLVEETGFDPFDAGTIAESWRLQPAAPAYCTELTAAQLPRALALAEKERLPRRRELVMAVIAERTDNLAHRRVGFGDWMVQLHRAICM
ncbi:NADPH-dependent F420 reductase (plasmid) [Nocardioides sp. R1-1]|uniref:NADPH-dependent F420 reductase n=1 Tax=Nocardioides sp. R1-1 TaxID=3383502 RepID=UPI0038D17C50